ncbi:uncharacterized protein F5891DRAFT_1195475 [Suillus fuscotomentosus]|uniref:Alpha-type protein kinase domain-containing protein n=1 Tax=Suillus fuscotomentosus TaxID=1912939 RepID=A0AAD4HF18_9AGAM|nr:uncharacterized protein F5891DRAFT_1195475 [Suillus fuscotomentosus]KAG1894208.1 hypothetical protein F5891DRAFT_1195475 [Suillus fuscotomentosus]
MYAVHATPAIKPRQPRQLDPSELLQPVLNPIQFNAAQRKSTINPPPVVPFSQPYICQSMCPASATHSAGPDITVPLSWGQPQDMAHTHRSSGASGYSENHAHYGAQHEHWAKLTYALPPMDAIMLKISAVHEGGKRKNGHGVPIGNIREGKRDIDACIDAPGLMEIAFDTILPKILTFGAGFSWCIEEFIVRDAMWVDLSTHKASIPYFLLQCMVTSKKVSKALMFKTKQFALMVVIPEAQWNEYEEWLEKAEECVAVPTSVPALEVYQRVAVLVSVPASEVSQPTIVPSTHQPSASTKRSHRQNLSISSTSSLPPHKKLAPAQVVPPRSLFSSPDRSDLKQALRSGGTTSLDVAQVLNTYTEHVQFYRIPTRPLADILKNVKYRSYTLDSSQSIIGQLTVNASICSMLGAGVFKTAHPGWLSLTPLMESGLGSIAGQAVALTYAFIDRCITSSTESPLFEIPHVRFVDAGLALSYSQRGSKAPAKGGLKVGSSCAGYLIEELIEGGHAEFVKFIHNMDSNPLLDYDNYRYEVAVFFAFTQHVQYIKMGGLAFILDYQGSTELLTHPQILTHLSVNSISPCNVDHIFHQKQHKCNKFCKWPGFGLEAFVEQTEEAEDEVEDEVEVEGAPTTP